MENKLNILVLTAEYPPLTGGAGSFIYDLVNGLDKYPCRIIVVTRGSCNSDIRLNDNLRIVKVKSYPKLFLFFMWLSVKKIYSRLNTDLIIINDVGAAMIAGFGFNDKMLKKTICILHGQEPEDVFIKNRYGMLGLKKKYMSLLNKCKIIVAVSVSMKEKFFQLTCNPDIRNKTHVVYNSISAETFYFVKSDLKQRIGISPGCKIFITVARFVKDKGHDTVLSILEKYQQLSGYDFVWLIVGSGEYESEFKQKVQSSPIQNQIKMTGSVSRDELKYYYSMSDVFILLSNFRESFGIVYLEASACGCPVIGMDKGGVKEVIENGVNGYLLPDEAPNIVENAILAIDKIFSGSIDSSRSKSFAGRYSQQNNSQAFWNLIKR